MKENLIKGSLAFAVAGITSYFNKLLIPIMVLVAVMVIDYITGMAKAWGQRTISSRTGVLGILKKVGYLMLLVVGGAVDWVIFYAFNEMGVEIHTTFLFGLIVCIWLIINELISILENLSIIGVPIPAFLTKIIDKLRVTVEEKVGSDMDEQDNLY